jgi:hypothetical protein
MAVLRSEHCRRPEPHGSHNGTQRWWDGQTSRVHCDGTPEFLAGELGREANPPPGPPSPPRPKIVWDETTPPENVDTRRRYPDRPPFDGVPWSALSEAERALVSEWHAIPENAEVPDA